MPKLTNAQLMLLSKAAQMGGLIFLPRNLQGAAAAKVVNPLLKNGLVKEVLSQPDAGAWRRDEATGEYRGLLITDAGRAAIQAKEDPKAGEQPPAAKAPVKPSRSPTVVGRKAATRKAAKQAGGGSPRAGSKLAKVIGMLTSKAGTTIEAIVKATEWLPHTTRAALTGLRKRGYRVEKEPREGGRTIYRIVGGAAPRKPAAKKRRKGR
jgi:Protein of unknown function (DUF3489)